MAKVRGMAAVVRTFSQYPTRFHAVARDVFEEQAAIIEQRMKAEASWQDQTGNARAELRCRVFDNGRVLRLQAAHGVAYGKPLEFGHQGRFAILGPTVRSQWPTTLRTVAGRVKGMKSR